MSLNDPIAPGLIEPVAEIAADAVLVAEPQAALAGQGLPSRFCCFVTGTDTEIGKTLVSSAILHILVAGGVRVLEVTLRTPVALQAMEAMAVSYTHLTLPTKA